MTGMLHDGSIPVENMIGLFIDWASAAADLLDLSR
jgi:hypothetical protein